MNRCPACANRTPVYSLAGVAFVALVAAQSFHLFFTVAAKCIAATAKQPRNNINPPVRIYVQIYVHLTHGQLHAHVCSVHLLPGRWQRTPTFNNDGCIVGPLHLSLLAVLTVRRSRP